MKNPQMRDIAERFADKIEWVDKETFIRLCDLLLEEIGSPVHVLEYMNIKSIDARLAKMVVGKDDSILNVGCGLPINEIIFKSWGVKEVVGFDIDESVIEKGKRWTKDLNMDVDLRVGDALNPGYPEGSFDIVVSFSAMEHVRGWHNYEKWIENMSKTARRNVVLTTSNRNNCLLYMLSRLVPHKYYEHFFSPKQIEELFLNRGVTLDHFETNTLMCNEYIPLPRFVRYSKPALEFNLFLERLQQQHLKNCGARMGFIGKCHNG